MPLPFEPKHLYVALLIKWLYSSVRHDCCGMPEHSFVYALPSMSLSRQRSVNWFCIIMFPTSSEYEAIHVSNSIPYAPSVVERFPSWFPAKKWPLPLFLIFISALSSLVYNIYKEFIISPFEFINNKEIISSILTKHIEWNQIKCWVITNQTAKKNREMNYQIANTNTAAITKFNFIFLFKTFI